METTKSDQQAITLLVGNQTHKITVRREDEPLFRRAAEMVGEKLSRYQESSQNRYPYERYLSVTALDFALQALKARRDADHTELMQTLADLSTEIDRALGEAFSMHDA